MDLPPEKVVNITLERGIPSIAYTYSEPIIFYEYVRDTARLAKAHKIRNILVTAGYILEKPCEELCQWIDGANVDIKAFSDSVYKKLSQATLKPVLRGLEIMRKAGVWIEITWLAESLFAAWEIARAEGLNFVYVGNLPGSQAQDTLCPKCQKIVIRREGYQVLENHLQNGQCPCGTPIPGVWS